MTSTDDESFCIEIPLGLPSQDRDFAIIQLGVMLIGLTFLPPDFRMFRFGIDTEPYNAIERASRAFSNGQSNANAR